MSTDTSDPTWRPEDGAARAAYWENVHDGTDQDGVSWWQSVPGLSLGLVDQSAVAPDEAVIDVGAGWSTLSDHLLERGFTDVTATDLSHTALEVVRERVGDLRRHLSLEVADVLDYAPGRRFALWHDRAVFHFLTEPDERDDYRGSLERCLEPGGWLVIATFGPDGPTTCSGLPIVRYTHDELAAQFPGFSVHGTAGEDHLTPWGTNQQFTALLLRSDQ